MTRRTVLGILVAVVLAGAGGLFALVWRPAIAPIAPPPAAAFDRGPIVAGAGLAALGDCRYCHTADEGVPYAGGRPVPTPFGTVFSSNITPDRQTGIGAWSEAAFRRAMRDVVDRGGGRLYPAFPYDHFRHLDDADLAALYAYLMTRRPVHAVAPPSRLRFPFGLRPLLAGWDLLFLRGGRFAPDFERDPEWNRGAYLVIGIAHCGACHTPHNAFGAEERDRDLAGGESEGWDAPALGALSAAPEPWGEDQLFAYLRTGIAARHGGAAGPMLPVVHDLAGAPEADVRAIAHYLAAPAAKPRRDGGAPPAEHQGPAAKAAPAGAIIFAGACRQCHGDNLPEGLPPLIYSTSLDAGSPRNAIHIVADGISPLTGEPGPFMPAFAGMLSDRQIAEVLNYARACFTDAPPWHLDEQTVHKLSQEHR